MTVGRRTARVLRLSPGFAASVELASVEPAVVFGQGLRRLYRLVVSHLAPLPLGFDKSKHVRNTQRQRLLDHSRTCTA